MVAQRSSLAFWTFPLETLKLLQRLLKSPGCRKIPVLVQNKDDVIVTASNFSSERWGPPLHLLYIHKHMTIYKHSCLHLEE